MMATGRHIHDDESCCECGADHCCCECPTFGGNGTPTLAETWAREPDGIHPETVTA